MICTHPGCRRRCLPPHVLCVAHRPKVKTPSGYSPEADAIRRAKRAARHECPYCWSVGSHDPLCRRGQRRARTATGLAPGMEG